MAKCGCSGSGFDNHGLIVVFGDDSDTGVGIDADLMQENEETWIAFIESCDEVLSVYRGLGELDETSFATLFWAFGKNGIAVGAVSVFAEFFDESGLEGRGDGVFEPLGLGVNFVPLHAEYLTQHTLDEVMAKRSAVGGLFAADGETNDTVCLNIDKAIAFEALDGHGDSRS
uniref:Uncharacterized protein n=1 Tax=mine drainage metagenome TaxID=410659 RepID=E6QKR0_9ZZZZ